MTWGQRIRNVLTALFLLSGTCFFVGGFVFFCELVELARVSQ